MPVAAVAARRIQRTRRQAGLRRRFPLQCRLERGDAPLLFPTHLDEDSGDERTTEARSQCLEMGDRRSMATQPALSGLPRHPEILRDAFGAMPWIHLP